MSFESGAGGASSHGPAGSPVKIQGDLASVVRSQKRLLRGMQGNLDRARSVWHAIVSNGML